MKERTFNTTGPCDPNRHYMLDTMRRLSGDVMPLIDGGYYFVIHAARQSGKTTLLMELTRKINAEGKYYALYCSLENAQPALDASDGIPTIINSIQDALEGYNLPYALDFKNEINIAEYLNAVQKSLTKYCRLLDKPLVIFFDETDCLSGQTLISFLRQLRNGYANRFNIPFVYSLALVGMRNIRDYRAEYRSPEQTLGSSSPFNIVKKAMTLRNFNHSEITELYMQHTADAGQVFEEDAVDLVWRQTQGQPWLVNAIASEIADEITKNNPLAPVTSEMAETAVQALLLRRDTHFDSLMARLHEERVRRIIEPMILGQTVTIDTQSGDYGYVRDIGLIRDDQGKIEPANPMYAEVILRALTWPIQSELDQKQYPNQIPHYLLNDKIDMDFLLRDFQMFWRENSAIWRNKADYQEAAPHLVLHAFLQRVINGGGQIDREMAAGTGRADLCLTYRNKRYPIELKLRYSDNTYLEGLNQLGAYMDILDCSEGWLVIFDLRKRVSWAKKIYTKKENFLDKTITVYGC